MLVSFIIIGIVLALGLYDYFSSRSWQMITSEERNDTVFEKRNKAYGAYQIRRNYDKQIILILLGIVTGTSGLYAASVAFRSPEKEKAKIGIRIEEFDPTEDDKDDKPEDQKDESPKTDQKLAQAETYKFVPFDVVDKKVENEVLPPDPGKLAGEEDKKGDPIGGGNPDPDPPIDDPKPDDITDEYGVPKVITELAYFPGGKPEMIKFIMNNINQEVSGGGKTKLKFLVSKDGSITKVWVIEKNKECDECDDVAVEVVKKMPTWTPGKSNGTPVNSYFYLPISFR